jgi:hypothetical protein
MSNLLGKVSTSADKVARKVLVDDCFGSKELRVCAANGLKKFLNFLVIRVTLIGVFVQRIEALCHDFGATLNAHAPFVTVTECVQLGLCKNGHSLTEFALTVVILNPR